MTHKLPNGKTVTTSQNAPEINLPRGLTSSDVTYLEHLAHIFANRAISTFGQHLVGIKKCHQISTNLKLEIKDRASGVSMLEERLHLFAQLMELSDIHSEILQALCVIHYKDHITPAPGTFEIFNATRFQHHPELFLTSRGQFWSAKEGLNIQEFTVQQSDNSISLGYELACYLLGDYGPNPWMMLVKAYDTHRIQTNGRGNEPQETSAILRLVRDDIGSQVLIGAGPDAEMSAALVAHESNRTPYIVRNQTGKNLMQLASTITAAAKLLQVVARPLLLAPNAEQFFSTENGGGQEEINACVRELWSLRMFLSTNILWISSAETNKLAPASFFDDPSCVRVIECYEHIKGLVATSFSRTDHHGLTYKNIWQIASNHYDSPWSVIDQTMTDAARLFPVHGVTGMNLFFQIDAGISELRCHQQRVAACNA